MGEQPDSKGSTSAEADKENFKNGQLLLNF